MTNDLLDRPTGFRWICEDRRRQMLDRRAELRGADRRSQPPMRVAEPIPHVLVLVASEQEQTARELRQFGMVAR